MGSNFHSPYDSSTKFKPTDMEPPLGDLDKALAYIKGPMVTCDGDVSFNPSTGALSWTAPLRVQFATDAGVSIYNYVAAGSITVGNNQFVYLDLVETNGQLLTAHVATVPNNTTNNFLTYNRLVLAVRNTASGKLYFVNFKDNFGGSVSLLPVRDRTDIWAPEYAGAVLTASGTYNDPGSLGMTSDVQQVTNNFYNYYEWKSSLNTVLQSYDIFAQIPIRSDFVGFQTTAGQALLIEFCSEEASAVNNALDITLQKDGAAATSSSSGLYSGSTGVWQAQGWTYTDAVLASLAAGDVLNVRLRMYSMNSKYIRVGKIYLKVKTQ